MKCIVLFLIIARSLENTRRLRKYITAILRVKSRTSKKPEKSRLAYSLTVRMEEICPSEILGFSKLQCYN
jgi:hypothetical protein